MAIAGIKNKKSPMHTSKIQKSTSSNAHVSKPFCNKSGEGSFFGQSKATNKPFFSAYPIQARLTIGQPGDKYEQEANMMADKVVQKLENPKTSQPIQRKCAACEKEEKVQMRVGRSEGIGVMRKPIFESNEESLVQKKSIEGRLNTSKGRGRPLEKSVKTSMESEFGSDFSNVKIHTDSASIQMNRDLNARAFTNGSDIYFNSGEYNPSSTAGKGLLAHELTHVVQQSWSAAGQLHVQRDRAKPRTVAEKLQAAKDRLKKKYGLKEIAEEGASWTKSRLNRLDAALSKMSAEGKKRLRGVKFVLKDKFPPKKRKGKTFSIAGRTTGTFLIELTPAGLSKTVFHELGHLTHNTAIANAKKIFKRSKFKLELERARRGLKKSRKLFRMPPDQEYLLTRWEAAQKDISAAARALERSGDADLKAKRADLEQAELTLPFFTGSSTEAKALNAQNDKLRAFVAALLRWSEEREKVVGKSLDEFVSIVKKHGLARRGFAPFTPYAKVHWPEQPGEFLAEAYQWWRTNPRYMKKRGRALFDWFEKGGHLGPRVPKTKPKIAPWKPAKSRPPLSTRCTDVRNLTESICNNSAAICRIAPDVDNEEAWGQCLDAEEACKKARELSAKCNK